MLGIKSKAIKLCVSFKEMQGFFFGLFLDGLAMGLDCFGEKYAQHI
ncbi:hypothetical protein MNB_SM-5-599 [hydrothermal vent metagenome]|uniref:Uncharacterized protein n=1 Tax=hydrothermal vent metagenome TaxID=652676 RepID=A0A1W1CLC0_9ZZZZ